MLRRQGMFPRTMTRRIAAVVVVLVVAVLAFGVWRYRGGGKPRGSGETAGAAAARDGTGTRAAGGGGGGRDPGAPAAARIEGRVVGASGALGGAVVRVGGDDGEPVAVAAGPDGRFTVEGLEAGERVVSAAAAGHLPRVERVVLRAGETHRLDFTLDKGGFALRGQVMDAQGGPIGGAIVSAAPRHGLLDGGDDGAAALTDDDGKWRGRGRRRATGSRRRGTRGWRSRSSTSLRCRCPGT